jgi:hypothetical protein
MIYDLEDLTPCRSIYISNSCNHKDFGVLYSEYSMKHIQNVVIRETEKLNNIRLHAVRRTERPDAPRELD